MQEDLFRPEAIEAQQQARQTGKILLTQSISLWALTLSTFVLIILLFLFLGFGEFTRKEDPALRKLKAQLSRKFGDNLKGGIG